MFERCNVKDAGPRPAVQKRGRAWRSAKDCVPLWLGTKAEEHNRVEAKLGDFLCGYVGPG